MSLLASAIVDTEGDNAPLALGTIVLRAAFMDADWFTIELRVAVAVAVDGICKTGATA